MGASRRIKFLKLSKLRKLFFFFLNYLDARITQFYAFKD